MKRIRNHHVAVCLLVGLAIAPSTILRAATLASDDANQSAYNSGFTNGSNGGSGMGAWTLSTPGSPTFSGSFVGNSAGNGDGDGNSDGDINVGGEAWGLYANTSNTASAVRSLNTAMAVNDEFTIRLDNGFLASGAVVGFGLRNSSGNNLVEFYYKGGDPVNSYKVNNGTESNLSPNIGFTDEGLIVKIKLTSATTFSLTATAINGGATSTFTGSLANPTGGQAIAQVRLFNFNAGSGGTADAFYNSILVDSAPTVSSIVRQSPSATDTNAGSVTFRVTFSEAVTGVGTGDFTTTVTGLTGHSITSVTPVSSSVYDVVVNTGTGNGTLRLDVPGSATIANGNGNDLDAAFTTGQSYTVDKTAPAAPSAPDLQAGSDSNINNDNTTNLTTLTFDGTAEAGSTVELLVDGFSVASGTATGGNWSLTATGVAEGSRTITARATDAAGNVSLVSGSLAVVVDTTNPAVPSIPDLSPASDTLGASNSDNITSDVTPDFTGTTDAGTSVIILVDNTPNVTVAAIGTDYTATATVSPGTRNITARARDLAGNVSADSSPLAITVDTTAPTVTSVQRDTPTAQDTNAALVTYRATFSEAMTASTVQLADFTLSNVSGTGGTLDSVNSVTASAYDIVVNTGSGDKELRLDVLNTATLQDLAGNTYSANFTTGQTYRVDRTAPAAPTGLDITTPTDTGTSDSDGVTNNPRPVITGTAENGATVSISSNLDGVLGTASSTGTFSFTPTADLSQGTHLITATATDAVGNTSSVSGSYTVVADRTAPTITSESPLAGSTVSSLTSVAVNFSEPVAGSVAGDLSVNSVAASAVGVSGNTVTFTVANPADGAISISYAPGSATDAAGNTVSGASWGYTKDSTSPTVLLSSTEVADSSTSNDTSVAFTATFSAGVTGFIAGDLSVTNGSISGFAGGPSVYTFNVIPATDGPVSVQVPASVATGTAPPNNPNAASVAYSWTHDATAPAVPEVSGITAATDTGASNSDRITKTVRPVIVGTGENGATITVSSSIAGVLGTTTVSSGAWDFTPAADLVNGNHNITATAADAVGNTSLASGSVSVRVDTTAPTISSSSPTSGATVASLPQVQVTFSESVTVSAANVEVNSSPATGVTGSGAGPYTFTGNTAPRYGAVTALVSGVQDVAGNAITADTLNYTKNSVQPAVTITSAQVDDGGIYNNTVTLTLQFSEGVTGFAIGDVDVTGGAKSNFVAVDADTYTVDVAPTAGAAVAVSASVAAGVANAVAAPNNGNVASAVFDWTNDTVAPSVSLVSVVPSLTNAGSFLVAVTLSESSINFVDTDVAVTGGTRSNFTGSGASYSFDVLLSTDGAVSVEVPAGAFTDAAGNANAAASNTISTTFDSTAPTSSASVPVSKVTGAIGGTYSASDANGIASVALYARRSDGNWALVGPLTGGTLSYTPASSGLYYLQTVATDNAGNSQAAPSGNTGTGSDSFLYNSTTNAAFTNTVFGDGTFLFPMKDNVLVTITVTGVTGTGDLSVSRTEGNNAPAGHMASLLIDESLLLTTTGTLGFTSASVQHIYEDSLLGGVPEAAITTAFRDDAGTVTSIAATVNTTANTIDFTTTGFSTWYFGTSNASTADWMLLSE